MNDVPLIDIRPFRGGRSAGRRLVADRIAGACAEIGFFAIEGHGVPRRVIAEMLALSHGFFDRPMAEKRLSVHPDAGTPRGYRGFAEEALGKAAASDALPDLKEFYHIGREGWPDEPYFTEGEGRRYFIPNLWPDAPAGFRETATAYYAAMERLAAELMEMAALALDLPEGFFDDKIDRHVTAMRINHYPAPAPAAEGQYRAGAHTDFGLFTILLGEDGPGGLQVRTRDGRWVDVATRPDFLVINIGDLFMRWTNDRWLSNMHRVLPPPPGAQAASRVSIGFFHQPNYDATIECIPSCIGDDASALYAPIRSGAYRDHKYRQTDLTGTIGAGDPA